MNAFLKYTFFKIVILTLNLLFVVCTSTFASQATDESWLDQRCKIYRGGYCRVPFVVALSSAKELAGRKVLLKGYLINERYGFALYENKESAGRLLEESAIYILKPLNKEIANSLKRFDRTFVRIRGRVVLSAVDINTYWVSFELEHPATIAPIRGDMN